MFQVGSKVSLLLLLASILETDSPRSPDSVICAMCKHIFHLSCLDPPLAQKPRVGYSWACAPCSKAHDEEVETYMETGIAPPKKVVEVKGKGKGKGKAVAKVSKATKKDKGKGKEGESRSVQCLSTLC